MSDFNFKVITPEGVLYNDKISSLTIRSSEGYLTILPSHFPLVTGIINNICHFYKDDTLIKAFSGNGILQVMDNEVRIIVSSFNLKEDIDIDRARSAKTRASERLSSDDPSIDKKRAQEALIRADSRIALWEDK